MKITLGTKNSQTVFNAANAFDFKETLKALGWRFDGDSKLWWVPADDFGVVRDFASDMSSDAKVRLAALEMEAKTKIAASRASSADIVVPVPEGLNYHPFQLAGIRYLLDHPNAILGDEMGLGKTIQVIGLTNADPLIDTILVVCLRPCGAIGNGSSSDGLLAAGRSRLSNRRRRRSPMLRS